MDSPFPGVDPYIEAQGLWPDFHASFLSYCRDALNDRLPESYAARMEEQVRLVRPEEEEATFRADLAVVGGPGGGRMEVPGGGVATLAPVLLPIATTDPEEVRDVWVEILRLPDLELVAVIELLSPSNKIGQGRIDYLGKRRQILDRPVHLVEIDLLLGGHRLPMRGALPAGDAFAIVSRAGRRQATEVYAWPLADGLPTIPVPLAEPDPDVPLDLAPAFAHAYRRGRYARLLRYRQPYPSILPDERRTWIEAIAGRCGA